MKIRRDLTKIMNVVMIYLKDPFRFTYHFNNQTALNKTKAYYISEVQPFLYNKLFLYHRNHLNLKNGC